MIADGDVMVGPDYLAQVAAAFRQPGVGLVSCPYRAGPSHTLGSALEALTIAADFIPSVAVANYVEGIRFALGATMALTRQALTAIGGLAPLADFLADDYQLGFRVAQTGLQVKILPYVVETHNPEMSFRDYLAHQLRWARTYRICRPAGYLAYGITHALVYSLAILLSAGLAPWAWGLVGGHPGPPGRPGRVLRTPLPQGPPPPVGLCPPARQRPARLRPLARKFPGQPGQLGRPLFPGDPGG